MVWGRSRDKSCERFSCGGSCALRQPLPHNQPQQQRQHTARAVRASFRTAAPVCVKLSTMQDAATQVAHRAALVRQLLLAMLLPTDMHQLV